MATTLGIIGGSGLYNIPGLEILREEKISTPFGTPSAPVRFGRMGALDAIFMPRHGDGHTTSPSEIPYRANIYALKAAGADAILSVSAVGSLKEDLPPGTLVLVDQFIDRTVGRERTFFDDGIVAHVAFGEPTCALLRAVVLEASRKAGVPVVDGGTYVCIEGPQFSTRAESNLFRSWGATVIGMTNLPEARLAREAELPYATLALVTDYDCWHDGHDDVTVDQVIATLKSNAEKASKIVSALGDEGIDDLNGSVAHDALQYAVITAPSHISHETRSRVMLLMKKHWGDQG